MDQVGLMLRCMPMEKRLCRNKNPRLALEWCEFYNNPG